MLSIHGTWCSNYGQRFLQEYTKVVKGFCNNIIRWSKDCATMCQGFTWLCIAEVWTGDETVTITVLLEMRLTISVMWSLCFCQPPLRVHGGTSYVTSSIGNVPLKRGCICIHHSWDEQGMRSREVKQTFQHLFGVRRGPALSSENAHIVWEYPW